MNPKTISGLCAIIAELCILVSSKTDAKIFFNYSPHVQNIYIRFFDRGWWHNEETGEVAESSELIVSIDDNHEAYVVTKLEEVIDAIKEISNNRGLVIK